jgi:D-glycero-D-manno-heptose 1,7-bisphosphate phosphatase
VLLAGFKSEQIERFASDVGAELRLTIGVVTESEPAGTAGALLYARDRLDETFLMMNGDSLFDFNVLDLAVCSPGHPARLALRRIDDRARYGSIDLDGDRIVAFREKGEASGEGLINGGVYWLSRSILDFITKAPCSLEREIFPVLAERGMLHGRAYQGSFIDIGVPDDLAAARANWNVMRRAPAVFFDRDGVLNHDAGYTHRVEDFRWIEGAREAIKRCNDAGRYVFVVTNQAGVARGYYDENAVRRLHAWMNEDLRTIGAHIDDFRYCPHHVEGAVAPYAIACDCRKPAPGMLTSLLEAWPVDASVSVLIGDKQSDLEAASAAQVRAIQFKGPADFAALA